MKTTKDYAWHFACLVIVVVVLMFACSFFVRARKGEDVQVLRDAERDELETSIRYIKDRNTGLCFAALAYNTDGYRTSFSISYVPCEALSK